MNEKKPAPETHFPPRFIASEVYRSTTYGSSHPLGIPRVSLAMDLCRALGWLNEKNFVDSPRADKAALAGFHDAAYIDAIEMAERDGRLDLDVAQRYHIGINGNPIFDGMYRRPATACGGGLYAARHLAAADGIFYSPGGGQHHGRADHASGFCYFNEPVLSIRELLANGISRVFYVDFDAHHGDVGIRIVPDFRRADQAPVGQVDLDCIGRQAFDKMPVAQHVGIAGVADDHAGAGFLDAAVLPGTAGLGRDVGLDVDHGRSDKLGDGLDHGGLGFEHLAVPAQHAMQPGSLGRRRPSTQLEGDRVGVLAQRAGRAV